MFGKNRSNLLLAAASAAGFGVAVAVKTLVAQSSKSEQIRELRYRIDSLQERRVREARVSTASTRNTLEYVINLLIDNLPQPAAAPSAEQQAATARVIDQLTEIHGVSTSIRNTVERLESKTAVQPVAVPPIEAPAPEPEAVPEAAVIEPAMPLSEIPVPIDVGIYPDHPWIRSFNVGHELTKIAWDKAHCLYGGPHLLMDADTQTKLTAIGDVIHEALSDYADADTTLGIAAFFYHESQIEVHNRDYMSGNWGDEEDGFANDLTETIANLLAKALGSEKAYLRVHQLGAPILAPGSDPYQDLELIDPETHDDFDKKMEAPQAETAEDDAPIEDEASDDTPEDELEVPARVGLELVEPLASDPVLHEEAV